VVCAIGLVNVVCVTTMCYFPKAIVWCVNRFDYKYMIIKLDRENKMHIPLIPSTFKKML
jgi:hypothetical protein